MTEYTGNLIPNMTGDTSPSGEVIYSSQYSTGYAGWMIFDGSTATYWQSLATTPPHYIGYVFESSKQIGKYTIYPYSATYGTYSWKFQGSNNGTTWVDLDTQTDKTLTLLEYNEFVFINNNSYTHYRLYITAANHGYGVFYEFQMMGIVAENNNMGVSFGSANMMVI